jgi:hypothetical protein
VLAELIPSPDGNDSSEQARAVKRIYPDAKLGFIVNQHSMLAEMRNGDVGLFRLLVEEPKRWKGVYIGKMEHMDKMEVMDKM